MAFGGPPTKRVYMGPPGPTQVPDTMTPFGDLDLRREVHSLRAEVKLLRSHAEGVTEVHNTFVGETVGMMDSVLDRLHNSDLSWTDAVRKFVELEQARAQHEQHFVEAHVRMVADKAEVVEKLDILADDLRKFSDPKLGIIGDVTDKMQFIEHHYVPDAIKATETKMERELRELRDRWIPKAIEGSEMRLNTTLQDFITNHAPGITADQQVLDSMILTALNERCSNMQAVFDQMGIKIATSNDVRIGAVETAMNKVYTGCDTKLRDIETELIKVMGHTVGLSKMVEGQRCPCVSGRCPCACNSSARCPAASGSAAPQGPADPLQSPENDSWAQAGTSWYPMTPGAQT